MIEKLEQETPSLSGKAELDLTVVVVSWNTRDLLDRSLETLKEDLERSSNLETEVYVVDNDSKDGSAAMVAEKHGWATLMANDDNLGFAKANNQVLRQAKGRYVLLLNPDTEVEPGALKTLIEFLEAHPKAGIVAPQLLNSDGSIQRSCRQFPTFTGMLFELVGLSKLFPKGSKMGTTFRAYKMLDWEHDDEREVDQPEGACLLLRREVLEEVGLLDEGYFMLFEEVDWCYRIKKAGWQIWFTPKARVMHHYGQSIKQVKARMILSSHRGLYRFWRKHYRGNRWYLDGFAYSSLMALAYFRIASHKLKSMLGG
ncbi:MAG TPA: glycosyltransferase family 2 protein [Candidatus Melainabacteria bacterium]|nr:glycosyltransferase family 2 protein [Candidatus Melainabacteria bacterium]